MRVLVPLAGVAASVLLLTACGSSSSGSGSGGSASASGASSPATTPPTASLASSSVGTSGGSGAAPTAAQLRKIGVQASDLPPGYTGKAATPDSSDDGVDAQLEACTGVKGAPDSDKVADVDSDDFTKGGITISSSFSSFRNQSDVDADVALINSPKVNDCLNSVFKAELAKSLGSQGTVDSAAIKLTPGSGGGPSNVVALASGVVNITAGGQKAAINLGVAFVTGPKIGGTLSYVGLGEQLDTATQLKVLTAVAGRAANPS